MKRMIDAYVRVRVRVLGVKAKKWHPDRKLHDQEIATKRFKEVCGLSQDEPFFC